MTATITFLGASRTVTGSKYLVTTQDGRRILVDCGLFQGPREWREKNWDEPPVDLKSIDCVVLTHAHVDHVGMLPRYVAKGLSCPVYCTKATRELAKLILLDSAKLQEEESEFRGRTGRSRHIPPLPLYTTNEAQRALSLIRDAPLDSEVQILPKVRARFIQAGHIIGACSIELTIGNSLITFSGDIGRYNVPILRDPVSPKLGNLLLIESTYATRSHPTKDPKDEIARIISEAAAKGGAVLVPSFAVGRTQLLLFYLRELKLSHQIPDIPIIVDSPMAVDATKIYSENPEYYDESLLHLKSKGISPFRPSLLHFIRDHEESKQLNEIDEPMVIIAGSGMMNGGRILHHLYHRVSDPRTTVLIVGYQPEGGRGYWLKSDAKSIRLMGRDVPKRANVEEISSLSAHADQGELKRWCESATGSPTRVAVVHGEEESTIAFSKQLKEDFGWDAFSPSYHEEISI